MRPLLNVLCLAPAAEMFCFWCKDPLPLICHLLEITGHALSWKTLRAAICESDTSWVRSSRRLLTRRSCEVMLVNAKSCGGQLCICTEAWPAMKSGQWKSLACNEKWLLKKAGLQWKVLNEKAWPAMKSGQSKALACNEKWSMKIWEAMKSGQSKALACNKNLLKTTRPFMKKSSS